MAAASAEAPGGGGRGDGARYRRDGARGTGLGPARRKSRKIAIGRAGAPAPPSCLRGIFRRNRASLSTELFAGQRGKGGRINQRCRHQAAAAPAASADRARRSAAAASAASAAVSARAG